jgi:hypothetical protein
MSSLGSALGAATGPQQLTGGDKVLSLALIVGFILLAGAVVIIGRRVLEGPPPAPSARGPVDVGSSGQSESTDSTLIRSWLAVSLVGGLLIFVAVSFWLDDTTLRSTLIGGVVANAGAAVAFYFASKSSDQARRDILSAALPAALVPNLAGKNLQATREAIASTPLRLEVHPATPGTGAQVVTQAPAANQSAPSGSTVSASFAGPVPELRGQTPDAARALLEAVGLQLDPVPAQPASTATATDQDPKADAAPTGFKVRVTFG